MSTVTSYGETRVNTTTAGTQRFSSVAALKDGGWLVTWRSTAPDGVSQTIYQQRYDAKGFAIGDEIRVNQSSFTSDYLLSTAGLSDGGWVVTWTGQDEDSSGIFQQRYNAYGLRVGHETKVNTTTDHLQVDPFVTGLAGGGWVVTWASYKPSYGYAIHQQRYGANGFPVGAETMVDSIRYGAQRPSVTALPDGGWIVTFLGYGSNPIPGDDVEIFQQRYDADGWTIDFPTQVNTVMGDTQSFPRVTALKDGGWVVTWSSYTGDSSSLGIRQQRYAANGQKLGTEIQVNTTETADQYISSIIALPDGGWLVTWTSNPSIINDTREYDGDIYQQRYAADGKKVGGETRVNTFSLADQSFSSVTVLKDGGWIVTWGSYGQDGDDYGIYQQRYTADGRPVGPTTPTSLSLEKAEFEEGTAGASSAIQILVEAFTADQGFTYTLLDNADGRFALSASGVLTVLDGSKLDYEQARSHPIKVEVKDKMGAAYQGWLTVNVKNVVAEVFEGSASSEVVRGGSGKDTFNGGAGNDRLWGGLGNDVLKGSTGRDIFVFDTKPNRSANRDKIVDFKVKDDTFWLDNAVFTKLGRKGSEAAPSKLSKSYFALDKAKDHNDYIVYSKKKGVLSYDVDGSGSKYKAVEIATLSKNLKMTYNDFFVI
jgi:hypothetical protein